MNSLLEPPSEIIVGLDVCLRNKQNKVQNNRTKLGGTASNRPNGGDFFVYGG
ncbi:MAG: hypothetical protein RR140_01760 [Clostridia bacterium]